MQDEDVFSMRLEDVTSMVNIQQYDMAFTILTNALVDAAEARMELTDIHKDIIERIQFLHQTNTKSKGESNVS